jgi:hypothetical protein
LEHVGSTTDQLVLAGKTGVTTATTIEVTAARRSVP